jgi:hypothetical protein
MPERGGWRGSWCRSRRAAVATAAVACLAAILAAAGCSAAKPTASNAAPKPFSGTPADHWADGTAGIVLPPATALGPYTRAQVQYAYQTTRKLLIAANLDKQTLLGGTPAAFAALLTSRQRAKFLSGLNKAGLDKQGYPLSTRAWVMSFPPGEAQLIGSVIKVRGSMYARAVRNSNGSDELDVHLDYIFVYPVEPPHQPGDAMRVVAEDRWEVQFADWQGTAASFGPWVDGGGSVSGVDCGTPDGYQHPAYPRQAAAQPTASPAGAAVDPYVMGQQESGLCRPTTGT